MVLDAGRVNGNLIEKGDLFGIGEESAFIGMSGRMNIVAAPIKLVTSPTIKNIIYYPVKWYSEHAGTHMR